MILQSPTQVLRQHSKGCSMLEEDLNLSKNSVTVRCAVIRQSSNKFCNIGI